MHRGAQNMSFSRLHKCLLSIIHKMKIMRRTFCAFNFFGITLNSRDFCSFYNRVKCADHILHYCGVNAKRMKKKIVKFRWAKFCKWYKGGKVEIQVKSANFLFLRFCATHKGESKERRVLIRNGKMQKCNYAWAEMSGQFSLWWFFNGWLDQWL